MIWIRFNGYDLSLDMVLKKQAIAKHPSILFRAEKNRGIGLFCPKRKMVENMKAVNAIITEQNTIRWIP